jgi:hypothetical protein
LLQIFYNLHFQTLRFYSEKVWKINETILALRGRPLERAARRRPGYAVVTDNPGRDAHHGLFTDKQVHEVGSFAQKLIAALSRVDGDDASDDDVHRADTDRHHQAVIATLSRGTAGSHRTMKILRMSVGFAIALCTAWYYWVIDPVYYSNTIYYTVICPVIGAAIAFIVLRLVKVGALIIRLRSVHISRLKEIATEINLEPVEQLLLSGGFLANVAATVFMIWLFALFSWFAQAATALFTESNRGGPLLGRQPALRLSQRYSFGHNTMRRRTLRGYALVGALVVLLASVNVGWWKHGATGFG